MLIMKMITCGVDSEDEPDNEQWEGEIDEDGEDDDNDDDEEGDEDDEDDVDDDDDEVRSFLRNLWTSHLSFLSLNHFIYFGRDL